MIYVYILQSQVDNGYYIGICKDIRVRLEKHNRGAVLSTKRRKPFRLIYFEEYVTYALARAREIEIKSYKGGSSFKKLIS